MSKVSSNAIAEITAVIARVTRTLSGRSIEVIQQGMRVGVEYDRVGAPVRVYLPSLADNPSPELVTAVQGFLDKEVSGLLYSNHQYQSSNRAAGQFASGMAGAMQSIIEDCRTEREMKGEFRGSAVNFQRNHDFAIKNILEDDFKRASDANQRKATLAMPAIRAASGELAYQEFMQDKWEHLDTLGGAILHYANDIQQVESTENTFDLTRKILRKWEELERDESDEDGPGSSAPKSGSGEGSGLGPEDGAGSGEESEDGDGDGHSDHDEMHRNNEDKELHDRERKPGGGSSAQSGLSLSKDLDDAFEKQSWNKRMEERIKTYAKGDAGKSEAYVPFSRRYDYVGPFPNEAKVVERFGDSDAGKRIYEAASRSSHIIQQQIQKLFMAKSLTRWEPGLKRGKINASALHKLSVGDPRIFRRKIESDSRELAVSLLIDMSGSMYGSKVQYAAQAALMFSDVLTKLGIQHEVSAFTTYSGRIGSSTTMASSDDVNAMLRDPTRHSDGVSYARYAPIVNFIAKGYSERLNEEKRKLIAMIPEGYSGIMANNVDGESVEIVGRRLLGRKEKRKIMIVMSDGSPAADGYGYQLDSHLKKVVKELSESGVEMLGLGLLDGSVKRYYPKHSVVGNVEEIPTKILELTRMMVVGA